MKESAFGYSAVIRKTVIIAQFYFIKSHLNLNLLSEVYLLTVCMASEFKMH